MLGFFTNSIELVSDEEGAFWLTSVYGPNISTLRKYFWMELVVPFDLIYPILWCVVCFCFFFFLGGVGIVVFRVVGVTLTSSGEFQRRWVVQMC